MSFPVVNLPDPNKRPRISSRTWGFIVLWVSLALVLAVIVGTGIHSALSSSNSSTATDQGSTDPIEEARAVMAANYGDDYSYGEVKQVTDAALEATGTPVNDEYRGRAWSAVLNVLTKQTELSGVDPLDVMKCAAVPNAQQAGITLPQVIALCAVTLK